MLDVRIWDIGHGLSVRIRTPSGQNHLIDAGSDTEFSPAEHIRDYYWQDGDKLDYLIISHFDADHVSGLPDVLEYLGAPSTYLRNKSVPKDEMYGDQTLEYQKALARLDNRYNSPVPFATSPRNREVNGDIDIVSKQLSWDEAGGNRNNISIVVSYLYGSSLIVFPGDIEPDGWDTLLKERGRFLDDQLNRAASRVLVAPHHGRESGFSQAMIDYIRPDLVVVSDALGAGETDSRFYTAGSGLEVRGEVRKCISTKTRGRKLIKLHWDGSVVVDG